MTTIERQLLPFFTRIHPQNCNIRNNYCKQNNDFLISSNQSKIDDPSKGNI